MIKRLQKKWKVSGWRLVLVLVTFATGGSLTGLVGKRLMGYTGIEEPFLYVPVYIIMVTLIWPLMVIIVSIPLGQYAFFKQYIGKMAGRLRGSKKEIHERPKPE
jgi:hypothetical protein